MYVNISRRLRIIFLQTTFSQGKTVQIVTFLGNIAANWTAFPALVVVPNSTITNWVREFERWAPHLRVVPFSGEKAARDVIKDFELFHKSPPPGNTATKFHVLVTTYETLTNAKEFTPVFKNQPRWEVSGNITSLFLYIDNYSGSGG